MTGPAAERASQPGSTRPGSTPPPTLLAAAALLAVQALGALVGGGWIEVGTLTEGPQGLALALSSGVLLLACGAGLLVVAWFLARCRRWTRGPTVAAELLALLMGYDILSASSVLPAVSDALGWVIVALSLGTLVLVLVPSSTAVFRDR